MRMRMQVQVQIRAASWSTLPVRARPPCWSTSTRLRSPAEVATQKTDRVAPDQRTLRPLQPMRLQLHRTSALHRSSMRRLAKRVSIRARRACDAHRSSFEIRPVCCFVYSFRSNHRGHFFATRSCRTIPPVSRRTSRVSERPRIIRRSTALSEEVAKRRRSNRFVFAAATGKSKHEWPPIARAVSGDPACARSRPSLCGHF